MIVDLKLTSDDKEKQNKIGEVIFKMNELGMIDSSDFINMINMANDNLVRLEDGVRE